jgi:predicted nucleic acid-binding protein
VNILFDTTFLVEIERKNKNAIELAKNLVDRDYHFWISTITVSEIMTGAYLRKDYEKAKERALTALNQFNWLEMNGSIALKSGEILAFLISHGRRVDYQDAVIAASAIELSVQFLVTENKKHFVDIPLLKDRVFTISELAKNMSD